MSNEKSTDEQKKIVEVKNVATRCQKHTAFGIGPSETPGAAPQYRQETKTA